MRIIIITTARAKISWGYVSVFYLIDTTLAELVVAIFAVRVLLCYYGSVFYLNYPLFAHPEAENTFYPSISVRRTILPLNLDDRFVRELDPRAKSHQQQIEPSTLQKSIGQGSLDKVYMRLFMVGKVTLLGR